MTEDQFYSYINANLGHINGGRVYVKAMYLPLPQPQPNNVNPFKGRLNPEFWNPIHVEVGILVPFGNRPTDKADPLGEGDTFDQCIADMRKNQPNLPLP